MEKKAVHNNKEIDWMLTLVPFILISILAGSLFVFPVKANEIIARVRFFFGDTMGIYYLVLGLGVFIISLYLSLFR